MEHSKIRKYFVGISILEFIFIAIWFYVSKPKSSSAFGILEVVLVLFGINLILGLILYFLKKRISVVFIANAIICPLLFFAAWIMWFTYWAN